MDVWCWFCQMFDVGQLFCLVQDKRVFFVWHWGREQMSECMIHPAPTHNTVCPCVSNIRMGTKKLMLMWSQFIRFLIYRFGYRRLVPTASINTNPTPRKAKHYLHILLNPFHLPTGLWIPLYYFTSYLSHCLCFSELVTTIVRRFWFTVSLLLWCWWRQTC